MKWIAMKALILQVTVVTVFGDANDEKVVAYKEEEQEAGSIVANMARIFSIRYNEREGRTFKLLDQTLVTKNPDSEKKVNYLLLDKSTGEITTSEKLDRETLCYYAEECIIQVQAVMLPNEHFTMLKMDVVIEDINDNYPIFQEKSIRLSVKEGEHEIGDAISIDQYKATDKDIGKNGELTYDLDNNPYFAVGTYTDESGLPHLQLRVLSPPDHEETSSLELSLTASDKGPEKHSDRATLTITIIDSNDNAPVFDKQEYLIKLKENDGPPQVVATVHAEDKDSGSYGTVRYSIPTPRTSDRTRKLAPKLFSINEMTGEIQLRKKVDREVHDGLRILVEASDSDSVKPKTGKTWLRLQVKDVNDNAPVITINFIVDSVNLTGYIRESASVKTYVAYVRASDADDGANGHVATTITTFGKYRKQRELEKLDDQFYLASDGLLATGRVLDREAFQYYVVEVQSCDGGKPPKCSIKNITVHVLDENDNPPIFDAAAKAAMIPEDKDVGSFVLNVKAKDADAKYPPSLWKNKNGKIEESRNGIVRYSIVQGNKEFFEVDRASGDIRLKKPLDHEETKEWKLVIEARDEGWQTSSSANCSIQIRVSDVNDNLPLFVEPSSEGQQVLATILREQVITTVKAVDFDAGPNSKVTYKITKQDGQVIGGNSSSGALFIINPNSGDLSLNFSRRNLTDQLGPHSIEVEATDSGNPPLSAAIKMHVKVIDELLPDPISQAGFDEKYIILALALGVASCILIIAIIAIAICRRRRNKKLHTYNCRSAEQTSKAWISGTLEMNTSRSEPRYNQNNSLKSSDLDSPKKVFSVNEKKVALSSTQGRVSDSNDRKMSTFKNASKAVAPSGILSTIRAMDRDSGRGDSDSENGVFASVEEQAAQTNAVRHKESLLRDESMRDNESTRTSELGPQCRDDCLTHGHSDICWMPPASTSGSRYNSLRSRGLRSGMTSSAPTLDTPYHNYESRQNEYPTLQHGSSRQYPRHPEHYRTMSFTPKHLGEHYQQNYDGELQPIAEMLPLNNRIHYDELPCVEDDISAQTQLTLSTSPQPMHDDRDLCADTVSRSSAASSRDFSSAAWQHRPSWDSRFHNLAGVQRTPANLNSYVQLPQDPRPLSPTQLLSYSRASPSSTELPPRYQEPRRSGSSVPFDRASNFNNPNYYYMNGSLESTGALTIQQAQGVISNVDKMFST